MTEPDSIGRRIAEFRKLRGWNQRELAHRTGYSFSAVEKIERGQRSVDRYSTINTFAQALGVDPSELVNETRRTKRQKEHATIPPIRRALMANADVEEVPARSLEEVDLAVQEAIKAREAGKYQLFGSELPILLSDLHRSVRAEVGERQARAHALLAEALHGGSILLRRLNYVDLSWIAVQQARGAAQQSTDPLLIIANDWNTIELYMRAGDTDRAVSLTEKAISTLDRLLAKGPAAPGALSLLGTMHLIKAIASAQTSDEAGVKDALSRASGLADRIGTDRNDYQTRFGPSNTAMFGVSTAVELGQGGKVVGRSRQPNADKIPARERQARYLIDVGRAYVQTGSPDSAFRVIQDAYKRAPEYVSHHVMAREVIAGLIERERRSAMPGLRTLAKKMGVI